MALYGVLGDIHGNREALEAALAALDAQGAERLLCVGDIVGYNADPDDCAELLRKRKALSIAGNHDLIGLGRLGFGRCSNKAMYSLKQTRRRLGPETACYLAGLPARQVVEGRIVLIHGGVRDVQQYMETPGHIRQNAVFARADFPSGRVFFFGHTHAQKVYEVNGQTVGEVPAEGAVSLRKDRLYFINPGSVDASRKREHKLAECALLDSRTWEVRFLQLPYDEHATEAKAARGGYRIGPWTDRLYSFRKRLVRLGSRFFPAAA
jgi:predicted phosphodiesterase